MRKRNCDRALEYIVELRSKETVTGELGETGIEGKETWVWKGKL